MAALIEAKGLAVGWGGKPILENLDFTVEQGSVFAILGTSGCGKSTLLRALIGLADPIAGTIHIEGIGAPEQGLDPPQFGVLFQSSALFGSMTLEENVALALEKWTALPPAAIAAVARARLRLVGLGGFENHLPAEVSGGMRKRAGIARALALDPHLLFLDEPSAGLDPVTGAELDHLILELQRSLGVTTVLVSHELQSILAVADRCIMLDGEARGIIAEGPPEQLRDESPDPRVRAFFRRKPLEQVK
jgi:phospholipid/cholesterol/gamma-HCH transport system ATP-binding protein